MTFKFWQSLCPKLGTAIPSNTAPTWENGCGNIATHAQRHSPPKKKTPPQHVHVKAGAQPQAASRKQHDRQNYHCSADDVHQLPFPVYKKLLYLCAFAMWATSPCRWSTEASSWHHSQNWWSQESGSEGEPNGQPLEKKRTPNK